MPDLDSLAACLLSCLSLVGVTRVNERVPEWSTLKFAIQKLNEGGGFRFQKPASWGWSRLDACRLTNLIPLLVTRARPEQKFLLQVKIDDGVRGGVSRHCCAVVDRCLVDPADGILRPLSPEAFSALKISGFVAAYLCKVLKKKNRRPKRKKKKKRKKKSGDRVWHGNKRYRPVKKEQGAEAAAV